MKNKSLFLATVLISFVTFLVYLNSLEAGLTYDDKGALLNPIVQEKIPLSELWKRDFWARPLDELGHTGSFRPLTSLSLYIQHKFSGLRPFSYHLVNLLLHLFCSLLLTFFAYHHLFKNILFASMTGLIFAVHAVHTEAVSNITGRAEILAAIFFLLSLFSYLRAASTNKTSFLLLSLLSAWIAMFFKETGITVLLVCFFYEIFIYEDNFTDKLKSYLTSIKESKNFFKNFPFSKKSSQRIFAVLSTFFLVLSFRFFVVHPENGLALLMTQNKWMNPVSFEGDFLTRTLTFNYLAARHAWFLVFPLKLSHSWQFESIAFVKSFFDLRNVATVIFYFVLALWFYLSFIKNLGKTYKKILQLSFFIAVFSFLPISNLFFYVGFVLAERVLYIPSISYSLLFALFFFVLMERQKGKKGILSLPFAQIIFVLLIFLHSYRSIERNEDWKSDETLLRADYETIPHNSDFMRQMSNILSKQGEEEKSFKLLEKAVRYPYTRGHVIKKYHKIKRQRERIRASSNRAL